MTQRPLQQLIENLGTRWRPKGIIELFAGAVWQKDTNIWLRFMFSIASCAKLQDEVHNSSDNSEMRSETQNRSASLQCSPAGLRFKVSLVPRMSEWLQKITWSLGNVHALGPGEELFSGNCADSGSRPDLPLPFSVVFAGRQRGPRRQGAVSYMYRVDIMQFFGFLHRVRQYNKRQIGAESWNQGGCALKERFRKYLFYLG